MNSLHDTEDVIDFSQEFWNAVIHGNHKEVTTKLCIHSETIWKEEIDILIFKCPSANYDPSTNYYVYDSFLQMLIDVERILSCIMLNTTDELYKIRYTLVKNAKAREEILFRLAHVSIT